MANERRSIARNWPRQGLLVPVVAVSAWLAGGMGPDDALASVAVVGAVTALTVWSHHRAIVQRDERLASLEADAIHVGERLRRRARVATRDRYRTATAIFEETVSTTAGLASAMTWAHAAKRGEARDISRGRSIALLRANLITQSERSRQLMVLLTPPPSAHVVDLETALQVNLEVLIDSLGGVSTTPTIEVSVAPGLVVDWTTETSLLLIAEQIVLAAAARDRSDQRIWLSIQASGGGIEMRFTGDVHRDDRAAAATVMRALRDRSITCAINDDQPSPDRTDEHRAARPVRSATCVRGSG